MATIEMAQLPEATAIPIEDITPHGDKDIKIETEAVLNIRRKKVVEWMIKHTEFEHPYKVLAEVLQDTQTVLSFHLAEENKQEFPYDDAVKVAREMAGRLLNGDNNSLRTYLKCMLLCLSPGSLTSLAVIMFQEFEKTYSENSKMLGRINREDEMKVTKLCICLYVKGLLSEKAQGIFKNSSNLRVQVTMKEITNKEIKGVPEQLLEACKTTQETEIAFYSAYRGWREIPQTDAELITEAMMKHLKGTNKEIVDSFLASMYYSLDHHALLRLAVAMFLKYREICSDKFRLLRLFKWNESETGREIYRPKFLARVLLRQKLLTEEECVKIFNKKPYEESQDDAEMSKKRKLYEENDLSEMFDEICKEESMHACDLLDYSEGTQLPYDDAAAIAKLMLPFLNGNEQQRKIYLKTMCKLSYRRRFWNRGLTTALTRKYAPDNAQMEEEIIGEYYNVAVIMCQQWMDQFPAKSFSELLESFSPRYMYLFILKCLWQWNMLSEVAVSFCVQSMLSSQRDEFTISHGFLPLLLSLPTTVYKLIFETSDASDFSKSVFIQSSHDFNPNLEGFMKILVAAAIERERQNYSPYEFVYNVLVKAIRNHKSTGIKVELVLDVVLQHHEPKDKEIWTWDHSEYKEGPSDALYLLAARRGLQFINVAFKIMEFLNGKESRVSRFKQLIEDEATDDHTVANIISKMIECKTIDFDDSDKENLILCCSRYAGTGCRSLTAAMLWKSFSDFLSFLDLLSEAENEDVPFAILEEFYIYLYYENEKVSNSLHVAAEKGYTKVVELSLERGFVKLLTYSNEEGQLPVQVAIKCKNYGTAAVMLRAMNDYTLCLAKADADSPDGANFEPRVNFRCLLDLLKKEKEKAKGNPEDLEECVMAILDSTVDRDGGLNHHEVLEVDKMGNTPKDDNFHCPPEHSIEIVIKNKDHFQAIIDHESFQSLVDCKWKLYGKKIFLIHFAIYLLFLLFLTTAFVLGAVKPGSPSDYSQPLDGFRLFCEIVVLLLTVVDILLEINQFFYCKWKAYLSDWTNWLENLAILLTLLIIPFRITDLIEQWVFVALAYILHSLRIFKYAVLKSSFAVYVKTLFQIIIRDIVQFLVVFIAITVSFGGGLYFSLRARTCELADQMTTGEVALNFTPVVNTSLCLHPDETSQIYLSWLTGFRLLIEGSVIDPYIFGDRGFWWFSVIIYIVFLFLVSVIMLNLLIAQFSKSFDEITNKVRQSVTPDRAKILVNQQSTAWIRCCCDLCNLHPDEWGRKFMSAKQLYRKSSPYKKTDEETADDLGKIHKQLLSSTSTDQKQFKELQAHLKEVKNDIANSAKEQAVMNKQAEKIETIQSDMTVQSKVVKELQSEVRSLASALREQTEIAMEQQRQIKESLKSLGEVKDILQQVLQK